MAQDRPIYKDPAQPVARRVADLVGRMTLEEKVSQMQDHAVAIPRLDVPEYNWWNEGLHGVARSGYATVFPQAIGLAATWDTPLMHEAATAISIEARAKNAEALRRKNHSAYFGLDLWSPNINIFRDPRWGRGQETYGEDPFLTSRMAVAFIGGLQGDDPRFFRTIATPKHFAVHSGPESTRHSIDVNPSAHDLEETYLPAFRASITEAHAYSAMCAYNRVDGSPACASTVLLQETLRDVWKFDGYVTSDCGAVTDFVKGHKVDADVEHAAAKALRAGTDTSCGAEFKTLTAAVKDGLATEAEIDRAVTRLFTARMRLGLFDPPSTVAYAQTPFRENDSEEHRRLSRKVAEESMVLLKNDGVLPLKKTVRTIAVVGPNAASLAAIEGNYNAIPSQPVLPLQGVEQTFKQAKVVYAQGSPYVEGLSVPVPRTALHPAEKDAREGLTGEYFSNTELVGLPVVTRLDSQINFDWNGAAPVKGVEVENFSVRWSGVVSAPSSGEYAFRFRVPGCMACKDGEVVRVWVDDERVSEPKADSKQAHGDGKIPFTIRFADREAHRLRIEYAHGARLSSAGIMLNWMPDVAAEREEAVRAAKRADVVLAFVGLSPDIEGEEMPVHVPGFDGGDRTSIELPAVQEQMLKAVAATGKPVVVVLMNGSALAVNWAKEHAAAIVEAWYPGEEGGAAIAQVLAGESNPAGRLPVTFYASLEQLPAFDEYSMKERTYRYMQGEPLFGFGYGLSYSRFAYSGLKVSAKSVKAGESLTVEASVKNTSARAGDEVAELYLVPPADGTNPKLTLQGFQRLHLAAGETRRVKFVLNPRQLSTVNAMGVRAVRAGQYGVSVGGAQPGEAKNVSMQFAITGEEALPR